MIKYNSYIKDISKNIKTILFNNMYLKFFIDKNQIPNKVSTQEHTYTIISAVYNTAPYLDKYFKSITQQTLDFEQHIYLILVDDGSTDDSYKIIKKWQKKYPQNILYIYQENSGQASARNIGLTYVNTPWITFIDPDDFINKEYFENIDKIIKHNYQTNLAMIGCNIKYYFEKFAIPLDRHPLRYKFKNTTLPIPIQHLDHYIQLSASSAFFKTNLIKKYHLQFDTKIKPNFEDAHFVNTYLLKSYNASVIFLKESLYYYRRRQKKTSTIDTSWNQPQLFDSVLKYGCINLFTRAKKNFGYVPFFLQKTILYHLSWYFKYMIDNPQFTSFLTKKQQKLFLSHLKIIFNDISIKTIENFDLSGIDDFIQSGWALYYKHEPLSIQTIHIKRKRKILNIHYYAHTNLAIKIKLDNKIIDNIEQTCHKHMFLNKIFINEYRITLPFDHLKQVLSIENNHTIQLETGNNYFKNHIAIYNIEQNYIKQIKQALYGYARTTLLGKS